MVFSSYIFVAFFLPLTLFLYFVGGRLLGVRFSIYSLVLMSLVYYGWWEPKYILVIIASITVNFAFGVLQSRLYNKNNKGSRIVLAFAVSLNLGALGYYKYTDFLIQNFNTLSGSDLPLQHIVLPLGISFFTFQQIAFMVDAYRGETREYNFADYCLFVTFFPQLIAGPIVHHKEMLPQFSRAWGKVTAMDVARGLSMFTIGVAKKVLVADHLAGIADGVFSLAANGTTPGVLTAWRGSIAYAMQIYFDFSGYSDMAIGLGLLFGLHLPINFNSPYKAADIIDFWRRWHMTLSRFLRDYVYFPLGGNRRGTTRRYANLLATMFLGGIWHGAGWTFVVWGSLHGILLALNHGWVHLAEKFSIPSTRLNRAASRFMTLAAVVCLWVYFRAGSVAEAHTVLGGMFSLGDWALDDRRKTIWVLAALAFALFAPNSQEFMQIEGPDGVAPPAPVRFAWRPIAAYALALGALFGFAFANFNQVSPFLYFQF